MDVKDSKVIMSPKTAKFLLKNGFAIIDLKPDRDNRERTMFIFRNSPELEEKLRDFTQQK